MPQEIIDKMEQATQENEEKIEKIDQTEEIIKRGEKIIAETKKKISEQKDQNKKSYDLLKNNLANFLVSIEGVKSYSKINRIDYQKNQELENLIDEMNEIQGQIEDLLQELEIKINNIEKENHPSPEEIINRLNFRESNQEEQERLEKRIPFHQKEALKICSNIFNKCDYPWYLTGSIAFLINATESKKQPDDIDIIFHEKDFDKMSKEFEAFGFTSGIAESTGCPFIKGKIEITDEKGDKKIIEMEAFGQKTEDPNGLINPGGKKY